MTAATEQNGAGLDDSSWRERITERGEDAVAKVAQELLDNSVVRNALSGVLGAGERVSQAQEAAMGVLNLPSAADVQQLTRRIRSLTDRIESVEDKLDQVEAKFGNLGIKHLEDRLQRLEAQPESIKEPSTIS